VALLVNRVSAARTAEPAEYFIVPIDECYKLVGLIRAHWRGFARRTEVWLAISTFFAELRKRSLVQSESTRA
jgi:hypothetical protein